MSFPSPDHSNPARQLSLPALRKRGAGEAQRAMQGRVAPVCPRCQVALEKTEHRTGIAWRCHGCGGESLNFSQFRRMIPELHANEIWLTAMEQPVRPQPGIQCPECSRDMAAVLVPFQGREIELDLCAGCQRLWMTPQENRPWSLDEKPDRKSRKPPVLRMKGRGVRRNRPEDLGSGPQTRETGAGQETKVRLWFFGVLLAVLCLLRYWIGW